MFFFVLFFFLKQLQLSLTKNNIDGVSAYVVLQRREKEEKVSHSLCSVREKGKEEREARITKLMVAFAIAAMRPRRCRRRMCIYVTNLYKYVL